MAETEVGKPRWGTLGLHVQRPVWEAFIDRDNKLIAFEDGGLRHIGMGDRFALMTV